MPKANSPTRYRNMAIDSLPIPHKSPPPKSPAAPFAEEPVIRALLDDQLPISKDDKDDRFIRFPRLPAEIRAQIWTLAISEPRLIYLHPVECSTHAGGYSRCQGTCDREIRIHGDVYGQASNYFFVNRESRHYALRLCNIRFWVKAEFDIFGLWYRYKTRFFVMSPNDILVSWHPALFDRQGDNYHVKFGPDARLVRNLIVLPWRRRREDRLVHRGSLVMAREFVDILGNQDALEKILFLHGTPPYYTAKGPCAHSETLRKTVVHDPVSYSSEGFRKGLEQGSCPELWLMAPTGNKKVEPTRLKRPLDSLDNAPDR